MDTRLLPQDPHLLVELAQDCINRIRRRDLREMPWVEVTDLDEALKRLRHTVYDLEDETSMRAVFENPSMRTVPGDDEDGICQTPLDT